MTNSNPIYLDNQATTPLDPRVLEEMLPFFTSKYGNPHSKDHSVGWESTKAIEQSSGLIASLLSIDEDEIIYTSGATESNNLAIVGLRNYLRSISKNKIITSEIEHKSILSILRYLERDYGFKIEYAPVTCDGIVEVDYLEQMIDNSVGLVSIMAVNNEIGTIQPIEKISEILKGKGVIFHCDAAQAPCAIDLDEIAASVDMLSLSGHKIYGPKGVGILFISRLLQKHMTPVLHGGGQQNGLRSGTLPTPLCVGIAQALKLQNEARLEGEFDRISDLRDTFVTELESNGIEFEINGSMEHRHPGNVNISFKNIDASVLLGKLQPNIAASTGSACSSGTIEESYVIERLHKNEFTNTSSVRFSFGRFNTNDEVRESVARLANCINIT